jgi:adenosylcobinamide-GDP ribazoletransferase
VKTFSPRAGPLSNSDRFAGVSGLFTAARYLTILPVPGGPGAGLGRAAAWFPVVGLGLGAALVAADHGIGWLFPGLLGALLTVTLWKVLTGGIHLDGLADSLDGLAGRDPDHRRRIMSDSRIGAFGAVGLILFLMIEVVAVAGLDPTVRWRALLAAPVIGRATSPVLARLYPPARADGQGAAFVTHVGAGAAGLAVLVALGVAWLVLGEAGLTAALTALAAAVLVGRFLAGRLAGITGDVLGAAVEIAELAALLTVTAWAGARS